MAKEREKQVSQFKLNLLSKLHLAPEARNEEAKGPYNGGRFKRFFDIFRANTQTISMTNMLTLIFAIPIFAVVFFFSMYGYEKFAYLIAGINSTPYLMGGIGIGMSNAMDAGTAEALLLASYRIMISAVALFMPVLAVGLSGNLYIMQKLVWGEEFLTKKDKQGNNIPRVATEFFRGVKKYAGQTVAITSIFAVFFGGAANLIITFVQALRMDNAGAGEWIALFVGIIIALIAGMIYTNWIPLVVSYDMPFGQKLKNACIYTLIFPIPSLFMLIFAVAPYMLFIGGSFLTIIAMLAVIWVGLSFSTLIFVNYGDYNSENIAQPLFERQQLQENRSQRKQNRAKAKRSKKR